MSSLLANQIDLVLQFSLNERIYILDKLWQSILNEIKTVNDVDLSQEQLAEIDRRINRIESGESKLYKWNDVKQQIKAAL